MSDWPKDEWSDPGARDYLEALGILSLRYDRLQLALIRLIERYLASVPEAILNQILFPLNNSQRWNLLSRIASDMEQSDEISDLITHFLKGFSICAENRNIALHAGGHLGETHLHFIKHRKDAPFDHGVYSISLNGLRAICDSMSEITDFAWGINKYIRSREDKAFYFILKEEGKDPLEMPNRPALPKKLTLPKRGQSHPDGPIFF